MDRDCEVAGPSRPRKRNRMQLGSDEIPMALFDEDTDLSSLSNSDTYQSVSTASQMDSSDSENEVATPSNVTANINWQDKPSNYTPKVYNLDSSKSVSTEYFILLRQQASASNEYFNVQSTNKSLTQLSTLTFKGLNSCFVFFALFSKYFKVHVKLCESQKFMI